jgi:nucleotide-binding universal stress UspA family protein
MMMRILYATDGSAASLAVAEFLAALPLNGDSHITVLSVAGSGDRADAESAVEAARERLARAGAVVETEVRPGHAVEQIVQAAEEHSAALLAVGSQGHSAIERLFVGSVAERVARHAPCPVLMVRPGARQPRTVVLGLDGSECSAFAAEWLQRSPLFPSAEIRLVTVHPLATAPTTVSGITLVAPLMEELQSIEQQCHREAEEWLDKTGERFSESGWQVVKLLKRGHPAAGLLEEAEAASADLIVVGSHGHSALDRFLLGSVSEHVLRHAPCSVLVAKKAPAQAN